MDYKELLKHPKWQKKRLEILSRDEWKCVECGDTESTLHVHHKEYINGRKPWEYQDDNFITLCKKCHELNHLANDLIDGLLFEHSEIRREGQKDQVQDIMKLFAMEDAILFSVYDGDLAENALMAIGNSELKVLIDVFQNHLEETE